MSTELKTFEEDCACPRPVQAEPVSESLKLEDTSGIKPAKMVATNTLNGVEVKVNLQ